jgi:hypothetical protein
MLRLRYAALVEVSTAKPEHLTLRPVVKQFIMQLSRTTDILRGSLSVKDAVTWRNPPSPAATVSYDLGTRLQTIAQKPGLGTWKIRLLYVFNKEIAMHDVAIELYKQECRGLKSAFRECCVSSRTWHSGAASTT